jgi:hypothetical protein
LGSQLPARAAVLVCLGLFLFAGCVRDTSGLTSSGLGKPGLSVSFPEAAPAGSTQTAVLEVSNPGPGEMRVLAVTFVLVGPGPNQKELPRPLIAGGVNESTGEIVSVSPEPRSVSDDGLVYTFDGLAEGATTKISFEIRVPQVPGAFANSVQVHDGQDLERLTGVRLDTLIER